MAKSKAKSKAKTRPAPPDPAVTSLPARLKGGAALFVLIGSLPILFPALELTLIEVVALLGPLVLAPIGFALTRPDPGAGEGTLLRLAELAQPAGALAAVMAVMTPRGLGMAGVLAGVWLAVTVAAAIGPILRWLSRPTADAVALPRAASYAFLVTGAVWLVIDRAGLTPLGLAPTLVTLTAVHFHTAGFATSVIAHRTAAISRDRAPRATVAAVYGIVGGPLVIASGFSVLRPALLVGAVILTAGLYVLSFLLLRHVRVEDRLARGLVVIAALAVLAPMALAVAWSFGEVTGRYAIPIPVMAQTHGLVNAFGFAVVGLLAFLRLDRRTS